MRYVIVNKDTNKLYSKNTWCRTTYSERGAKIVCTKLNKQGSQQWYTMSLEEFDALPTPMVERKNYMTGELFLEPANTPWACSPASETYWSS